MATPIFQGVAFDAMGNRITPGTQEYAIATNQPYTTPITGQIRPSYAPGASPAAVAPQNLANPFTDGSAPTITTPTDVLAQTQSLFQSPQPIQVPSVLSSFQNIQAPQVSVPERPEELKGLGPEYYQRERDRRTEALRREFLGPLGTLNQVASQASAGGILGSGVGKKLIQEKALSPFAQALVGAERDVSQMQAEERARLDQLNAQRLDNYADRVLKAEGINIEAQAGIRDFLGKLAMTDSSNIVQAQIANNETKLGYDKIASQLASDQAKLLTSAQIDLLQAQIDQALKAEQIKIDQQRANIDQQRLDWQISGGR